MTRDSRTSLRLWPGVCLAALVLVARLVIPVVLPQAGGITILLALIGGLGIFVWWLLFSRAAWSERIGALGLIVVALYATSHLAHESIATGMMGMLLYVLGIPVLGVALVAWALAAGHLSRTPRLALLAAAILFAGGAFTLIRTGGVTGEADSDLHWRWTPTPEERLLASTSADPASRPAPSVPLAPRAEAAAPKAPAASPPSDPAPPAHAAPEPERPVAEWPGFRGPARNSIVQGAHIEVDWSRHPPVELWRRPIGPGWSSFAVQGGLIYTQEQRGEDEIVSAYDAATGAPVWRHRDSARFWESNGGPGPRATPTLADGRLYTLGATGILNALDARSGAVIWSRNVAVDTGATVPEWGIAASPLVLGDAVVAAAAGSLAAYDAGTGAPRWVNPAEGADYSSPHAITVDGVEQILLLSSGGARSVAPANGSVLWQHDWARGVGIVQPATTADGDILISAGDAMGGLGIRRLAVSGGPGGWSVVERWTSRGLKPYFNDFVVHEGHAFGFDGSILSCIDLEDGSRKWKGGRYGHGQLVLLPDQDLLLVLTEEGELALVRAAPDGFTELARVPAIEGKTWNHPVLIGDVLLVRNGEEMAAFRLSQAR